MGHDDRADHAGGNAPAGRPGELLIAIGILELDLERLGEVLAEEVARSGLERLRVAHHRLAGVGVKRAGEALAGRLDAFDDGQRQVFLHDLGVDAEHLLRLGLRFVTRGMGSMALLPEELRRAQEQAGTLLPAHDVAPLVDQQGQIAPRLHPLGEHRADHRLRRGTDDERLFQLFAAGVRDDRALGREALNVLSLLLEIRRGDQQREIGIDVSRLFKSLVELGLDDLPHGIAGGTDDHAAAHGRVIGQLGHLDDVEIPLRIILRTRGNVACHCIKMPPENV